MAKRQITYLAYARCCWGAIFSIRNLYPSSWRKRWVNPIPQSGEFITRFINVAVSNAQLIIDNFPKLNRFLTGYDLRHVFNDEMTEFDLTRILTGSEGTLAFITEARLDITPLPKVRRLVNVKYDSFDSALRNAPFMVEARALSVETVDSKVLNLAREDIVGIPSAS